MAGYVYFHNRIIAATKAVVPIGGPGCLYGQGLFETMRVYNGRVFALEEHLRRLFSSLPRIKMKINFSPAKIKKAIYATIKSNRIKNGYLRLTVWQEKKGTSFSVTAKKSLPYIAEMYSKGFSAAVSPYRQNEFSPLAAVKSTNYFLNILARKDAEKRGYDEAVLLNTRGAVCEGSRTNIFLVKSGRLMTPDLRQGCLDGITRKIVLELARKNKMAIREKAVSLRQLLDCDEAFLTNSLMEIIPLVKVNNRNIKDGKPGKVSRFLLQCYRESVKLRTGQ